MDRGEYEDEQEALRGIVVTLLGLAVLAELLCVLPLRVRVVVLTLLRPAEAVARAFAIEWAGGALALPPIKVCGADGDGRAEASRLALCFRVLASSLGGLPGFAAWRRSFRGGLHGRLAQCASAIARRGCFIETRRAMAFRGAACIDTS